MHWQGQVSVYLVSNELREVHVVGCVFPTWKAISSTAIFFSVRSVNLAKILCSVSYCLPPYIVHRIHEPDLPTTVWLMNNCKLYL